MCVTKQLHVTRLLFILIFGISCIDLIENPFCKGDLPRYYHGETCNTYWLCYDGYQYPTMQCPGELVYSHLTNGCDVPEKSVCPGDDIDGYIKGNLIQPERIIHKSCGYRHKNGEYEIHQATDFTTPELCGFRQVSCLFNSLNTVVELR